MVAVYSIVTEIVQKYRKFTGMVLFFQKLTFFRNRQKHYRNAFVVTFNLHLFVYYCLGAPKKVRGYTKNAETWKMNSCHI